MNKPIKKTKTTAKREKPLTLDLKFEDAIKRIVNAPKPPKK